MVTQLWVNIDSGNGLLPDRTKPLPEPMLTSSVRSSENHLWAVAQEIPRPAITEINLEIIYVKFLSNLPATNELNYRPSYWLILLRASASSQCLLHFQKHKQ